MLSLKSASSPNAVTSLGYPPPGGGSRANAPAQKARVANPIMNAPLRQVALRKEQKFNRTFRIGGNLIYYSPFSYFFGSTLGFSSRIPLSIPRVGFESMTCIKVFFLLNINTFLPAPPLRKQSMVTVLLRYRSTNPNAFRLPIGDPADRIESKSGAHLPPHPTAPTPPQNY